MPEILRSEQAVFSRTGGLHAAALFDSEGQLMAVREDIGRHNAVDKIVGWALLEKYLPLSRHILLISGRGGFEIAQKALAAGIPILASVSAPSSLAVKLARELGLTLIGFCVVAASLSMQANIVVCPPAAPNKRCHSCSGLP